MGTASGRIDSRRAQPNGVRATRRIDTGRQRQPVRERGPAQAGGPAERSLQSQIRPPQLAAGPSARPRPAIRRGFAGRAGAALRPFACQRLVSMNSNTAAARRRISSCVAVCRAFRRARRLTRLGRQHLRRRAAAAARWRRRCVMASRGWSVTAALRLPPRAGGDHPGRRRGRATSSDAGRHRLVDRHRPVPPRRDRRDGLAPVATGDAASVRAGHVVVAVRSQRRRRRRSPARASSTAPAAPWRDLARRQPGPADPSRRRRLRRPLGGAGGRCPRRAVIGVATAALVAQLTASSLPASTVSRVVARACSRNGHVARPWLGISAQTGARCRRGRPSAAAATTACSLLRHAPGGPAERAGLSDRRHRRSRRRPDRGRPARPARMRSRRTSAGWRPSRSCAAASPASCRSRSANGRTSKAVLADGQHTMHLVAIASRVAADARRT